MRRWTEHDERVMRAMFAAGDLQVDIAERLGRSPGFISQKMAKAGLVVDRRMAMVRREQKIRELRKQGRARREPRPRVVQPDKREDVFDDDGPFALNQGGDPLIEALRREHGSAG